MGDVERENARQGPKKSTALAAVLWSYTLKYSRRLAMSMATNKKYLVPPTWVGRSRHYEDTQARTP